MFFYFYFRATGGAVSSKYNNRRRPAVSAQRSLTVSTVAEGSATDASLGRTLGPGTIAPSLVSLSRSLPPASFARSSFVSVLGNPKAEIVGGGKSSFSAARTDLRFFTGIYQVLVPNGCCVVVVPVLRTRGSLGSKEEEDAFLSMLSNFFREYDSRV